MAYSGPRNWPPLDEINGEQNVKYHGATGNGLTDDTPAFRAAVGAAQRLNGVVSIPAGVYRVSNLQVPDNIWLIGENATLKALVATAGNGAPILDVTGVNVGVFGLRFDGDAANQPADGYSDSYNSGSGGTGRAYRAGIKADGTVHTLGGLKVEGCEFTNLYGAGIATQNLTDVIIANNYAHNTRFEMAFLYGSTLVNRNAIIMGNLLRNIGNGHASVNANGILISGYQRSSITGNVGYIVERNFVKIEHGDDVAVSGNAFHTNSIDSFGGIQTQGNSNRIAITGTLS